MQYDTKNYSTINEIKKKIYQRVVIIGLMIIPVFFVIYYIENSLTTLDWVIYLTNFIFNSISVFGFIKWKHRFIKPFEYFSFSIVFIFFLGLFVVFLQKLSSGSPTDMGEFSLWVAIIYIIAFLYFSKRQALQLSAFFIFGLFVIGFVYGINEWGQASFSKEFGYLMEVFGSSITYITMLYFTTALKEQYIESEVRSKLMTSIANTDSLTGVYSRSKISELLDYYVKQAQLHKQSLSIVILDVDRFKHVNDNFGHATGDYVLRRMVELLRSNLRENDYLGRWGGDEFLLICPDANEKAIFSLANRLENSISPEIFSNIGNPSISTGTATYQTDDSPESLLQRADIEMYKRKKEKRENTVMQINEPSKK